MSNGFFKLILTVVGSMLLSTACYAQSAGYPDSRIDNFPMRIVRMASNLNRTMNKAADAYLTAGQHLNLDQYISEKAISKTYGADMAWVFVSPRYPYLLMNLAELSSFCLLRLKRGSACGSAKLPTGNPNFNGYLFVTNWIQFEGSRYLLLLMSSEGQVRTTVARVTYTRGVNFLYDTIASKQKCISVPAEGLPVEDVLHKVTTLSNTTFKLDLSSDVGPISSAVWLLSVGASSCHLTLLSHKFRHPPSAASDNNSTTKQ